jgi:threonine dehydratase
MNFLRNMQPDWNISLFHYRNHGSDSGRVLVGMQVPKSDLVAFDEFLDELGYRHWDETNNPAYRLFL